MKDSIQKQKSYRFALKTINACKEIASKKKEFLHSKQLLKSGTAIGALIHEAEFPQLKADFISKLSIALKESNETHYWLLLLKESGFITEDSYESLNNENQELIRMLVSSIKTAKLKKDTKI
jgi:four helix bundle protein